MIARTRITGMTDPLRLGGLLESGAPIGALGTAPRAMPALLLILMALIAGLTLVVLLAGLLVVAGDAALSTAVLHLLAGEVRTRVLEVLARALTGDTEVETVRREKVRIGKGLFRGICRRHAHRERLAVRQLAGSPSSRCTTFGVILRPITCNFLT